MSLMAVMHAPEQLQIGIKGFIHHAENDHVLALRRTNGQWTIPGGRLEENIAEPLGVGLQRELEEESGLSIDESAEIAVLGLQMFRFDKSGGTKLTARIYAETRATSGDIRLDADHDRHLWLQARDLRTLPLEPTLRAMLPLLLRGDGTFAPPVAADRLLTASSILNFTQSALLGK